MSRVFKETARGARVGQDRVGFRKLSLDLVWLDGVLGKAGAAGLLFARRAFPLLVDVLDLLHLEQAHLQARLREQFLEDGLNNRFGVRRHRNTDTERVVDFPRFAEQDIEHGTIDGIVPPIE